MRHELASSVTPSRLLASSSRASMSRGTTSSGGAATARSRNRPMPTGYGVISAFYGVILRFIGQTKRIRTGRPGGDRGHDGLMGDYRQAYQRSMDDPEGFWRDAA